MKEGKLKKPKGVILQWKIIICTNLPEDIVVLALHREKILLSD